MISQIAQVMVLFRNASFSGFLFRLFGMSALRAFPMSRIEGSRKRRALPRSGDVRISRQATAYTLRGHK